MRFKRRPVIRSLAAAPGALLASFKSERKIHEIPGASAGFRMPLPSETTFKSEDHSAGGNITWKG